MRAAQYESLKTTVYNLSRYIYASGALTDPRRVHAFRKISRAAMAITDDMYAMRRRVEQIGDLDDEFVYDPDALGYGESDAFDAAFDRIAMCVPDAFGEWRPLPALQHPE